MKRIVLLVLGIGLLTTFHIHNATSADNQGIVPTQEVIHDSQAFLETLSIELKQLPYIQDILPNNFSYLTQLLVYGTSNKHSRDYVRAVFRLFGNTLKRSGYVNAYAFDTLIKKMPSVLHPYFVPYKSQQLVRNPAITGMNTYDRFHKTVNTFMLNQFSHRFDYFQDNPEQFLQELSFEILQVAQEEISTEVLRQTIIRFLELALNKLVWNPEDTLETWQSTKNIAYHLAELLEYNIIEDVHDLEDLFQSLTHRYCLFLDLTSEHLPREFYEKIKEEVLSNDILLLALEESDPLIETKANCLMSAIEDGLYRKRG